MMMVGQRSLEALGQWSRCYLYTASALRIGGRFLTEERGSLSIEYMFSPFVL